jgi:hypothetical protein
MALELVQQTKQRQVSELGLCWPIVPSFTSMTLIPLRGATRFSEDAEDENMTV